LIDRLSEEVDGDVTVVATGGVADKIIPHCRRKIIRDDDLVLKGLEIIYRKNCR
jgi:type III pantothenate kinase